ncbi:hypothetical protein CL684_00670 [Candidatus Campbellbacteria bacterium]|nr:hypothetical protein [Candidatus Campbellbacteria bacterium]|tara:strand:+ start:761 stop:1069 length:309 start_codon:yes stop_codon:yes gene_type:complete
MNDPLKDTRVFPEEMHEKPQPHEEHHHHRKLLWAAVIAFIAVAIYVLTSTNFFKQEKNGENVSPDEIRYAQEEEAAVAIERFREELTPEERERRLNMLFNNN